MSLLDTLCHSTSSSPQHTSGCRKLMTAANSQHAKECEEEHESEGILMEELGRLLGEVKASARSVICSSMLCKER